MFHWDKWLRNLFSGLCRTDGRIYHDNDFECVPGTEYEKRVNLQQSHEGAGFTWGLL